MLVASAPARAEALRPEDLRPTPVHGATTVRELVTEMALAALAPHDAPPRRPVVDLVRRPTFAIAPRREWGSAMPGLAPTAPPVWDVSVFAGIVRRTAPATRVRDDRAHHVEHRAGTDDTSDLVVVAFPPPLWIALIGLGVAAGARRRATAR
ncbi:MAG: hypothetical protein JNM94_12570 [Phycisphaerae bacterium]|nr:hypothetical protein [Phycisphaerae bacterium]